MRNDQMYMELRNSKSSPWNTKGVPLYLLLEEACRNVTCGPLALKRQLGNKLELNIPKHLVKSIFILKDGSVFWAEEISPGL